MLDHLLHFSGPAVTGEQGTQLQDKLLPEATATPTLGSMPFRAWVADI